MTILALFLFIIFVLTVLELFSRIYCQKYGKRYVWTPYRSVLLHIDQEALPRIKPICRFDVNCDGELSSVPPDFNCCRFLTLGGSSTECYYLGSEGSWPTLLQNKLNEAMSARLSSERVHVGNISKSGFTARDLGIVIEGVLPNYSKINTVVLMVGAGDVLNWMKSGTPDVIEESNCITTDLFSVNPRKKFYFKIKHSALYELARLRFRRALKGEEVKYGVGKKLTALREQRQRAKTILNVTGNPQEMLNNYESHLSRCISQLRQINARILLIPQPWFDREANSDEQKNFWNASMGHAFFEPTDTYYSMEVFRRYMFQIYNRTLEIARKEQVETVEVKSNIPCDFKHYYDCIHFTNLGAEKVAQTIFQYLDKFPHMSN